MTEDTTVGEGVDAPERLKKCRMYECTYLIREVAVSHLIEAGYDEWTDSGFDGERCDPWNGPLFFTEPFGT